MAELVVIPRIDYDAGAFMGSLTETNYTNFFFFLLYPYTVSVSGSVC